MTSLFCPDDDVLVRIHAALSPRARASVPITPEQLVRLVETAFWASLEVNEGRATRVRIALVAAGHVSDGTVFSAPVPYDAQQIAKLGPATPQEGCLLVTVADDGLWIWGLGRERPAAHLGAVMLDVWEPGVVRVGIGPYPAFAVLNGRANAVIEGRNTNLPRYLQRILDKSRPADDVLESKACWRECGVFADLARMIVADGHGGIVLVVPDEVGPWMDSLNPFAYRFATADTSIADTIRRKLRRERDTADVIQKLFSEESADSFEDSLRGTVSSWPVDVDRGVRAVASLAEADGAVVMTRELAVLGFGAKIAVRGNTRPQTALFRPVPGDQDGAVSPFEDIGGTRHQSSARFVDAHHDAVALVISQDRHLSVIHWDGGAGALCVLRNAEWWI